MLGLTSHGLASHPGVERRSSNNLNSFTPQKLKWVLAEWVARLLYRLYPLIFFYQNWVLTSPSLRNQLQLPVITRDLRLRCFQQKLFISLFICICYTSFYLFVFVSSFSCTWKEKCQRRGQHKTHRKSKITNSKLISKLKFAINLPSTFWKLEHNVLVQVFSCKLSSFGASMSIKHSIVTHLRATSTRQTIKKH